VFLEKWYFSIFAMPKGPDWNPGKIKLVWKH
jgi:hypothetical protein